MAKSNRWTAALVAAAKQRDASQRWLAEQTGISRARIRGLFAGAEPRASELQILREQLGISVEWGAK